MNTGIVGNMTQSTVTVGSPTTQKKSYGLRGILADMREFKRISKLQGGLVPQSVGATALGVSRQRIHQSICLPDFLCIHLDRHASGFMRRFLDSCVSAKPPSWVPASQEGGGATGKYLAPWQQGALTRTASGSSAPRLVPALHGPLPLYPFPRMAHPFEAGRCCSRILPSRRMRDHAAIPNVFSN